MKVQDELSGEVFRVAAVYWVRSNGLPRDNWATTEQMRAHGASPRKVPGSLPWARADDGGESRWLPVEVLS